MNRLNRILAIAVFAVCSLIPVSLWCEELFIDVRNEARMDTAPVIAHTFGGVQLPLALTAWGEDLEQPVFTARLVQLSNALALPLPVKIEFPKVMLNAGEPVILQIPVPEVKRVTTFELRVSARTNVLRRVWIRVYPNDLLRSLRSWASQHVLVVQGKSEPIDRFLRNQGIAFRKGAVFSRSSPRQALVLNLSGAPIDSAVLRTLRSGDVVLEQVSSVTSHLRVSRKVRGGISFVRFTGSVLEGGVESPLNQMRLLELFRIGLGDFNSTETVFDLAEADGASSAIPEYQSDTVTSG